MKRSTKLVLGFAVAGITFASLMAFAKGGNHFRNSCDHQCGYHRCHEGRDANKESPASSQDSKTEDDSTRENH